MTDEETLKKEPVQLDLFSDPENIDDSDERAFVAKCNFIEQQRYVDFPDITRVYLPDFVSEIFERPQGDLKSVEPFEERGAERYKKWREEENAKKEHDYSKEAPKLVEITPGHFVLANSEELEAYKKKLK